MYKFLNFKRSASSVLTSETILILQPRKHLHTATDLHPNRAPSPAAECHSRYAPGPSSSRPWNHPRTSYLASETRTASKTQPTQINPAISTCINIYHFKQDTFTLTATPSSQNGQLADNIHNLFASRQPLSLTFLRHAQGLIRCYLSLMSVIVKDPCLTKCSQQLSDTSHHHAVIIAQNYLAMVDYSNAHLPTVNSQNLRFLTEPRHMKSSTLLQQGNLVHMPHFSPQCRLHILLSNPT